jgi:hypothetical protein
MFFTVLLSTGDRKRGLNPFGFEAPGLLYLLLTR